MKIKTLHAIMISTVLAASLALGACTNTAGTTKQQQTQTEGDTVDETVTDEDDNKEESNTSSTTIAIGQIAATYNQTATNGTIISYNGHTYINTANPDQDSDYTVSTTIWKSNDSGDKFNKLYTEDGKQTLSMFAADDYLYLVTSQGDGIFDYIVKISTEDGSSEEIAVPDEFCENGNYLHPFLYDEGIYFTGKGFYFSLDTNRFSENNIYPEEFENKIYSSQQLMIGLGIEDNNFYFIDTDEETGDMKLCQKVIRANIYDTIVEFDSDMVEDWNGKASFFYSNGLVICAGSPLVVVDTSDKSVHTLTDEGTSAVNVTDDGRVFFLNDDGLYMWKQGDDEPTLVIPSDDDSISIKSDFRLGISNDAFFIWDGDGNVYRMANDAKALPSEDDAVVSK